MVRKGSSVRFRQGARRVLMTPSFPARVVGSERVSILVGARARTYRVGPASAPRAPVLLVVHGAGGSGDRVAAVTGFAERGPAAGFCVAFPDGLGSVWSDERGPRDPRSRGGVDDVAFLDALVAELDAQGLIDPAATFAT